MNGFAVNTSGGYRSVGSPDDLEEGELFSLIVPEQLSLQIKTREQVEADRLYAYAHPVTGSDRFIAEAAAERLAGNTAKADTADAALLTRREEIAAQNPWPIKGKK